MKVLLLAPHPFYADRGTPIAVRALAQGLVREGHAVTLLTLPEGEDVPMAGVELLRLPWVFGLSGLRPGFSFKKLVYDAAMFLRCLQLLRERRFDLIHAVEESAFVALAMTRLREVPFVYDMDSSMAQQLVDRYPVLGSVRGLLDACEAGAVRGSTGVLAVCQALVDVARQHDPDQLIGRLEDVSLLGEKGLPADDLPVLIGSDGPIVMYVGNLEPYQGIDLLVEAFAKASAQACDAQLVVIGGEEAHIQHYRRQSEELGIAGRTHWLGPRPVEALGAYLGQASILASPRIHGQNTAMKVYSYLDSGRPVLATRLPTHTQVLDDEISQLAAPEVDAMAEGLLLLLRDPVRRESLAGAARQRVREEYSPEAWQRKLGAFYQQVEESMREGRGA